LFYLNIADGYSSVFDHQDSTGQAWYLVAPLRSTLGAAFGLYDWRDVTHLIWIAHLSKFYCFDFRNWRYWVIDRANGLGNDWVGHPVKSLDHFLQWPQGWGKK
jgi:hypothetical protein